MNPSDPPKRIAQMLTGYWVTQMIHVAAKLDLAGLLEKGARPADELARLTGTHPRSLYRLLRGLASLEIFRETSPRVFEMTPLAQPLLDGVPGSQRAMAIMSGEEHFEAWGELLECVKTSKTGFEKRFGMRPFDYMAQHPDAARVFDAAMISVHGNETPAMLAVYDFEGIQVLADIGGGNGSLIRATLGKHPRLKGILYDLPHVIERARGVFTADGLDSRCQCVTGSFFDSVPEGADAYLLRHIIHDWDDDESVTILKNCRRAMGDNLRARLLVLETVIPSGNDPMFGKLLDLNMLVIPGGLERTELEYRELFAAAGFRLSRIIPTSTEVSILEGIPVP